MPSGNGCRAQMKRERNAKAAQAAAGGKSQIEVNKKAMNIICAVCRQSFLCTSKEGDLRMHYESKHSKGFTFENCFPDRA